MGGFLFTNFKMSPKRQKITFKKNPSGLYIVLHSPPWWGGKFFKGKKSGEGNQEKKGRKEEKKIKKGKEKDKKGKKKRKKERKREKKGSINGLKKGIGVNAKKHTTRKMHKIKLN